jgi:hypothetical protein
MSARKIFRRLARLCAAALLAVGLGAGVWIGYRVWPRQLRLAVEPRFPALAMEGNRLILAFSPDIASAKVAGFDDQLEAFLHFEYLRGREGDQASRILLTATHTERGTSYEIFVLVENDLLTAIPRLTEMESRGLITHYELNAWTKEDLAYFRQQSNTFETAYNAPTERKLETLTSFQLFPALAHFLIFKSQTDSRVAGESEVAPRPLTLAQANQLAADILDVAYFYSLPLDYFLGVGAMENNYMDANGDLAHAVWKKRAQRDDIVLRRSRRRVLVSDYSIGTWQISRETLRYAHLLYLKDTRNYDLLPARLRPAKELDLNSLNNQVMTTYAGLLLRDLLDRFGGDVDKAVGAYNGGVRSPNPAYTSGVKTVADYARRVIEHATVLDDQAPAEVKPAKGQPLTVNGSDVRMWWTEP